MTTLSKDELYPLLFEPMYRRTSWGGSKLAGVLHRELPAADGPFGEAWDICDREGAESAVANGPLAGTTLHELCASSGASYIIGDMTREKRFPLLVKIVDAGERIPLQVNPDENAARQIGNGAEAKTKMWYVLDADPGSKIMVGIRPTATRHRFLELLSSPDVETVLQTFESVPGDAYFLNAGRVHSLDAGNLVLDIQLNSNTDYCLNDWGRPDPEQEIRLEEGLRCIDFIDRTPARIPGVSDKAARNRKYAIINRCPQFHCDELHLAADWPDTTRSTRSFHLLTAISGPVDVEVRGSVTAIPRYMTALLPAALGEYVIRVKPSEPVTLIRTTH
jgi:mannose-6-phosphate isomerase